MIPNSMNSIKVNSSHINDDKERLHALSILMTCLYIIVTYENGIIQIQYNKYSTTATIKVGAYHMYNNTWFSLGLGFLIKNGINGTIKIVSWAEAETRDE